MKKGSLHPTNVYKLRNELKLSQTEIAAEMHIDTKTYRDIEKGHTTPRLDTAITMREYYKSMGLIVSLDYILGLSDFRTPENDYIGNITGLNDTAIDTLKRVKRSDEIAIINETPALRLLPALNALLCSPIDFEPFLQGFNLYINPEFTTPVYHTGNKINRDSVLYNKVTDYEAVSSTSTLDYDPENKVLGFPRVDILHFAKPNDYYDTIDVPVDREFLQAVAMNKMEQALFEIRDTISEQKEHEKDTKRIRNGSKTKK